MRASLFAAALLLVGCALHTSSPPSTEILDQRTLGSPDRLQITTVTITLNPKERIASAHRHSGTVFAYVAAGTVSTTLDGATRTYSRGQYFVETPKMLHEAIANVGAIRAIVVATMLAPPAAPWIAQAGSTPRLTTGELYVCVRMGSC